MIYAETGQWPSGVEGLGRNKIELLYKNLQNYS